MEENKCLHCGKMIYGRKDKKFCSESCRNNHNNDLNADRTSIIRNTNNALRKNYRILEQLCTDEKAKTTRGTLLKKGFDFTLLTSIRTTQKGSTYYFVYDMGYLNLDNDFILLVKDNKNKDD